MSKETIHRGGVLRWGRLTGAAAIAVATACGGAEQREGGGEEVAERPAAEATARVGELDATSPRVRLETSRGEIVLALYAEEAPATVQNFLAYVREGFYDGLIFHRVIEGFMIQGGGFTPDLTPREPSREPIRNESPSGLGNFRGTVAMARTGDPHSATAQFFINQRDNDFLNHGARAPGEWGYAVFGRVEEGMDVVDAIAGVPTGTRTGPAGPMQDVPLEPPVIRKMTVVGG